MTNEEFLARLERLLEGELPDQEIRNVMDYHREYFAEAGENAASELDTPETIARRVLDEYYTPPAKGRPRRLPTLLIAVAVLAAILLSAVLRYTLWRAVTNQPRVRHRAGWTEFIPVEIQTGETYAIQITEEGAHHDHD